MGSKNSDTVWPHLPVAGTDVKIVQLGIMYVIQCGGAYQGATFYNESMGLKDPEYSLASYASNVERILQMLRHRAPKAALAVCTFTPVGEDLNSDINAKASHPMLELVHQDSWVTGLLCGRH
jgi:hypothetical protein